MQSDTPTPDHIAAVYMNTLSLTSDPASWWAHTEIDRLRAELDRLRLELQELKTEMSERSKRHSEQLSQWITTTQNHARRANVAEQLLRDAQGHAGKSAIRAAPTVTFESPQG